MKTMIEVTLAGLTFPCALHFPEAAASFPSPDPAALRVGGDPVCISDADWAYYAANGIEKCAHMEYSMLTAHFSDALMPYDRIILHAVALRRNGRAYLIAAPSGVGKTTQTRFLQELCPGEIEVICGDRPVLEFRKHAPALAAAPVGADAHTGRKAFPLGGRCQPTGLTDEGPIVTAAADSDRSGRIPAPAAPEDEIVVHPSAWNGKENWKGGAPAPLAGLILLDRGEENRLCALQPREAMLRVYAQMIQTCLTEDGVRKSAELTTRLLNAVPLWGLTSHTVPDSTRLLLDAVF